LSRSKKKKAKEENGREGAKLKIEGKKKGNGVRIML
jgi:hypothetical protein